MLLPSILLLLGLHGAYSLPTDMSPAQTLNERQVITDMCMYQQIENDKFAHEINFHRQLSDVMNCGTAETCSSAELEEHSFGVQIEIGGEQWVGASASFGWEWTSGSQHECGGIKEDRVCVWVKVPYSEYTAAPVQGSGSICSPEQLANGNVIKRDPLQNGQEYYCVTGSACRTKGQGYWEELPFPDHPHGYEPGVNAPPP